MVIQSHTGVAAEAVSGLKAVGVEEAQEASLSYSTGIIGMATACQVTNQVLVAVGEFHQAVMAQADKIPEIAEKIAVMDQEEAQRWEVML